MFIVVSIVKSITVQWCRVLQHPVQRKILTFRGLGNTPVRRPALQDLIDRVLGQPLTTTTRSMLSEGLN